MNPILPRGFFIPDVEAHVMQDGRLYLYGSNDISGSDEYCSHEYHVFSTTDPTLSQWQGGEVSFSNTKKAPGISWQPGEILYAPDAAYRNGRNYLFICGANAFEAVATAEKPDGPFESARPVAGADGDGIDPAVFVDDDGQAYYFWGQFHLRGAKLTEDMAGFVPGSKKDNLITEQEHGFHEGASVRKYGGKYYLVFTDISRGRATCISYAVADAPLGPYTKGGVIIDNIGCDPETWNNHGSIEEFCGQWYVFYHRSSQGKKTCRRVCAEPIFFDENGHIAEVEMTSQGAGGPLNAFEPVDASVACRMRGNCRIMPDERPGYSGCELLANCGGGSWAQDWAEYRYLDFSAGASVCTVSVRGKGSVSVMVQGMGVLGTTEVCAADFCEYQIPLCRKPGGLRAVWLLFDSSGMDVDWFSFEN